MGVAAGNDGSLAYLTSPASEKTACTIGATDKTDAKASYSNYGSVVDILALGSEIISTWINNLIARLIPTQSLEHRWLLLTLLISVLI